MVWSHDLLIVLSYHASVVKCTVTVAVCNGMDYLCIFHWTHTVLSIGKHNTQSVVVHS